MKALQYIFTSWKNGDSQDKGYMIYSKSNGISDSECADIKRIMRYSAPRDLKINPTEEEIEAEFPYNFASFKLSSGRRCIALSTYLGKDYSGRFGNYIIYALVIEESEMDEYPVSFFAESFMKNRMEEDELNATPPIPPLEPLEINKVGEIINFDTVIEFAMPQEDKIPYVISCILESKKNGIPFCANDTRENLVLWCSLIQMCLPIRNAKKISFSTYVGDLESLQTSNLHIDFCGVRDNSETFSYRIEKNNNRYIVIDFESENMTDGIPVTRYAKAIGKAYGYDFEIAANFNEFLDSTNYDDFNYEICAGYDFYLIKNHQLDEEANDITVSEIIRAIEFGVNYCSDDDNREAAVHIIDTCREYLPGLSSNELCTIVDFMYRYADYLAISIYEFIHTSVFNMVRDSEYDDAKNTYLNLKKSYWWKNYLQYCLTDDSVYDMKLKLDTITDVSGFLFYVEFYLNNYDHSIKNIESEAAMSVVRDVLRKISDIDHNDKSVCDILNCFKNNSDLYIEALLEFVNENSSEFVFDTIANQFESINGDMIMLKLLRNKTSENIGVQILAGSIRQSDNPEKTFHVHSKSVRKMSDADLTPMINAYLRTVDDKKLIEAYKNIIEIIGFKNIQDRQLRNKILSKFNQEDIKTLSRMENILRNISSGCNYNEASVINAVLWAIDYTEYDNKALNDMNFDVAEFSNKQYNEFLKIYLNDICFDIKDSKDFKRIFRLFSCSSYEDKFANAYVDFLKKLKKKSEIKWLQVLSETIIVIVNDSNMIGTEVEKTLIKYCSKLSDEEVDNIEKFVGKTNQDRYMRLFFEKIRKKESLKDKLLGSIRRRN